MSSSAAVVPGDVLVLKNGPRVEVGRGAYIHPGSAEVRSSLWGRVVIETLADGVKRYNVLPRGGSGTVSQGISVSDKVLCRVTRIATHQCFVDILSVNEGHPLGNPTAGIPFPKGVVRREDVRLENVDALVMPDCFRPGDIIRAAILSLGDTRVYFLSTASEELGVIRAISSSASDGGLLEPVSWSEMRDKSTGKIEHRKVAKI